MAGDYCPNKFQDDLIYKTFFIKDSQSENIECIFYECFDFIDEALKSGGKILIHCVAGISRSVTITAAYLMYLLKIGFE